MNDSVYKRMWFSISEETSWALFIQLKLNYELLSGEIESRNVSSFFSVYNTPTIAGILKSSGKKIPSAIDGIFVEKIIE